MEPYISTGAFYGNGYKVNEKIAKPVSSPNILPFRIKDLVNGPPITWKVFKKQAEALDFISKYKHNLMGFAFESGNTRLFLVAHPEVFWHYDCQRPPNCRCSYEIISENSTCKLYFDLEYNIPLNPIHDGPRMTQNFIALVNYFLNEQFNIVCDLDDIINLDASTNEKFSRHLIYYMPNICFANNGQAGNFVNYVCGNILKIAETGSVPAEMQDLMNAENCSEMIVEDIKHNKVLFCDLSVYSRNRHFRLYKSTKFGKSAPLLLSPDSKKVISDPNSEKELFLGSLITFIPSEFDKLKVLYYENTLKCRQLLDKQNKSVSYNPTCDEVFTSPYKDIDNFINDLVFPGKIFRSFYFSTSKVINYDIVGNRFCGNIGRQHKSNNIKYIVDLSDGTYYQKCHDYECAAYKSEKKLLPSNLQLMDCHEKPSNLGEFDIAEGGNHSFVRFPSCGVSDEEILNHFADQTSQQFNFDVISQNCDNNPSSNTFQRFPSFDLSDEDIINHLSSQNLDI